MSKRKTAPAPDTQDADAPQVQIAEGRRKTAIEPASAEAIARASLDAGFPIPAQVAVQLGEARCAELEAEEPPAAAEPAEPTSPGAEA